MPRCGPIDDGCSLISHAPLPCAEYPAVIDVARKLLVQRLHQLLSERNLLYVLLGIMFVALGHIHEVA